MDPGQVEIQRPVHPTTNAERIDWYLRDRLQFLRNRRHYYTCFMQLVDLNAAGYIALQDRFARFDKEKRKELRRDLLNYLQEEVMEEGNIFTDAADAIADFTKCREIKKKFVQIAKSLGFKKATGAKTHARPRSWPRSGPRAHSGDESDDMSLFTEMEEEHPHSPRRVKRKDREHVYHILTLQDRATKFEQKLLKLRDDVVRKGFAENGANLEPSPEKHHLVEVEGYFWKGDVTLVLPRDLRDRIHHIEMKAAEVWAMFFAHAAEALLKNVVPKAKLLELLQKGCRPELSMEDLGERIGRGSYDAENAYEHLLRAYHQIEGEVEQGEGKGRDVIPEEDPKDML